MGPLLLDCDHCSAWQRSNDANVQGAIDRKAASDVEKERIRREAQRGSNTSSSSSTSGSTTTRDSRYDMVDCWNGQHVYRFQCPKSPAELTAEESARKAEAERNRRLSAEASERIRQNEAAEARQRESQRQAIHTATLGTATQFSELRRRFDARTGLPTSTEQIALLEDLKKFRRSQAPGAEALAQPAIFMAGVLQFEMAEEWRLRGYPASAKGMIDPAIFDFLSAAQDI